MPPIPWMFRGKEIFADNTDGVGLLRDSTANLRTFRLQGKRGFCCWGREVLAGRACTIAVAIARAELVIANRTRTSASQLMLEKFARRIEETHSKAESGGFEGVGADEILTWWSMPHRAV